MDDIDLNDQFLIAMPGLVDPNFFQTVTYIFSHTRDGAMGLIINRPLTMELGEILAQMQLMTGHPEIAGIPVHEGGPVKTDRGFVIHPPDARWASSVRVNDRVEVTTSRDILEAIARGRGPDRIFIALGYAGWEAGQLEQELMDNCWLTTPADSELIFHTPPALRWESAAARLGVSLQNLSSEVGHA